MPPPTDLPCPNCGRLFFAHSLPFHLKKCEAKRVSRERPTTAAAVMAHATFVNRGPLAPKQISCKDCGARVFSSVLSEHLRVCPSGAWWTMEESGNSNGIINEGDKQIRLGGSSSSDRLACRVCKRIFDADRIKVHEGICARLSWNQEALARSTLDSIPERRAPWEQSFPNPGEGRNFYSNEPSRNNTLAFRDWKRFHKLVHRKCSLIVYGLFLVGK